MSGIVPDRWLDVADLADLVGTEIGVSDWTRIDQDMVDRFADLTGDDEWIHVDVPRATAAYGATVVHGYLVLSLLPMLTRRISQFRDMRNGLNYGLDRLRFMTIVFAGDMVRLRRAILSVADNPHGKLVRSKFTIEVMGKEKPAMVAEGLFLVIADTPR